MSVSRHPVALRPEQQVGDTTWLLATVMGLPLIDGVFLVLIIAEALVTTARNLSVAGTLQTGLPIFGGSTTVVVTLTGVDGTRHKQLTFILLFGVLLIPVAVAGTAVAETIETLLNFEMFHRFTGLAVLAVAAKTASSKVDERFPSPSIIIGLDLVASFESTGPELAVAPDPMRPFSAGAAVGTGIGFTGTVVLFTPRLRGNTDIDLFRFGNSVVLGMLVFDVLDLMSTQVPVALDALVVTALFALDPGSGGAGLDEFADDAFATESTTPNANANEATADGGDGANPTDYGALVDDMNETNNDSEPEYGYPGEEESRTSRL